MAIVDVRSHVKGQQSVVPICQRGFPSRIRVPTKRCSEWGLKFSKDSGQFKVRKRTSMAGTALGRIKSYTYGIGRLAKG